MIAPLRRHAYSIAVAALSIAVLVAGTFVLVNIVVPAMQTAQAGAVSSPAPSPSPSGSSVLLMNGAAVPADSDCSGCHRSPGGLVGLRPIPSMAHPLEGWSKCTACHATASLVSTAPGHSGIHATECLLCHKPGPVPQPLSRPHRDRQNTACLSCHGSKAPLPADMQHRSQTVCWLCHRLPEVPPPVPAHQTATGESDCLACHVAGKVGALPADHTPRRSSECLLCHEVPLGRPSPAPIAPPTPTLTPLGRPPD